MNKTYKLLSAMVLIAMLVTACASATATPATTEAPAPVDWCFRCRGRHTAIFFGCARTATTKN
jgi:hypothetical protein